MLTVDYTRLRIGPGTTVIDVGCGAGRHSFEAYRRGADVIAFDQNAEELAEVVAEVEEALHDAVAHGERRGPSVDVESDVDGSPVDEPQQVPPAHLEEALAGAAMGPLPDAALAALRGVWDRDFGLAAG